MKELMESRNVPIVRNFFYSISFRDREMVQLSITIALHGHMQNSFIVHPLWNQVVSSFMEIKNIFLRCICTTHSSTAQKNAEKTLLPTEKKKAERENKIIIHMVSNWVKRCYGSAWLDVFAI